MRALFFRFGSMPIRDLVSIFPPSAASASSSSSLLCALAFLPPADLRCRFVPVDRSPSSPSSSSPALDVSAYDARPRRPAAEIRPEERAGFRVALTPARPEGFSLTSSLLSVPSLLPSSSSSSWCRAARLPLWRGNLVRARSDALNGDSSALAECCSSSRDSCTSRPCWDRPEGELAPLFAAAPEAGKAAVEAFSSAVPLLPPPLLPDGPGDEIRSVLVALS